MCESQNNACRHHRLPWIWIIWFLLALPGLLAGCSKDNSDPSPTQPIDDTYTGEALFEESTAAIAQAKAAAFAALQGGTIAEALAEAAASLLADPNVASAVCVTPTTRDPYLVAEFTNGIVFTMPVVRLEQAVPDPKINVVEKPSLSSLSPTKNLALAANNKAIFLDLPEFETSVSLLSRLANLKGFNETYKSTFTVNDLRNLTDYGLVYISSHGHLFEHQGQDYFELMTWQKRDTVTELQMLAANELQNLKVTLGDGLYVVGIENPYFLDNSYYWVTDRFIGSLPGSFPENCIFYADCCQSTMVGSHGTANPMAAALGLKNVGAYLGWDNTVYNEESRRATNYLISYGLGYVASGLLGVPTKTPPLRPFSLQDSFVSLQILGWDGDSHSPPTHLELFDFSRGSTELSLVPSIGQVIVDVDLADKKEELKILGDFGGRRGRVHLREDPQIAAGAQELTVRNWEDSQIICDLGGEKHGYVVVSLDGRTSNEHPLSQWTGAFEITGTSSSGIGPTVNVNMNAVWRAEIVEERPMPELPPLPEYGWASTMLSLEASCDYVFSGIFEDSRYIYEYREEMNTGNQPVEINGQEVFMGTVTLKPSEASATIQVTFTKNAVVMKTDKQNPELPPVQDTVLVPVPVYLQASMDAKGTISPGSQAGVFMTTWDEIAPESPVLDSTRR